LVGATLVVRSAGSKNRRAALASRGADEHVDDLAELIDRSVHVALLAGDLHVRLVHLSATPDRRPARPGGIGQ
jgi:hypothetical protein